MIEISENIPLPCGISKKKVAATRAVSKIIRRFQEAYRAVYGKTPMVIYNDPWVKIDTQKTRVSTKRLLEMSRQLETRML